LISPLRVRGISCAITHTGDYRNPNFDNLGAVAEQPYNGADVIKTLSANGPLGVVLTGSIFEQDEGAGGVPSRVFRPTDC